MVVLPEFWSDTAPVFVAPMAGGPSTPTLVTAAAEAGHFAQLAAGYRTAAGMLEQIAAVRASSSDRFGVNLFVPNISPVDADAYRTYRDALRPTAARFGVEQLPAVVEDDDDWDAKVSALLADPVPVVSFTFGLPDARVVERFRAVGTVTVQTVTSAREARAARERGIAALVVQGAAAGGHSGVLDATAMPEDRPLTELVQDVAAATGLPIIAAGGISDAGDVADALQSGAAAVAVGTLVLRTPESGASSVYKDALVDPAYDRTVLTRVFTGRPARALRNRFVEDHDVVAPLGYPAVHHLTRPIRAAATAVGDPNAVNLWAGTGWRSARDAPVADTLRGLIPG